MQRRHFETIARILRDMPDTNMTRWHAVGHFANELAATNPRFNRDRFLKACGYGPDAK